MNAGNDDTLGSILSLTKDMNVWCQALLVEDNSGSVIDISCAVGKANAKTPEGATGQPEKYPPKTCYRFPTIYKGAEQWEPLISMLREASTTPGCTLVKGRKVPSTTFRHSSRYLLCKKYMVQGDQTGSFKPGQMALPGIKKESVTKTKTRGQRDKSALNMYSKKAKRALRDQPEPVALNVPKHVSRMGSERALDKETRCNMYIEIFHSRADDYFYLSTSSNLCHNDHPFKEERAHKRDTEELTDDDLSLMELMFEEGVSPTQIARILSKRKGKEHGSFLPKTLYDMNRRTKRMKELAEGITWDMSDAQKTLRKLEAMDVNHYVVYHDYDTGLMAYHQRGRPTKKQQHERLNCPEAVQAQIAELRRDLAVDDNKQVLLLVSMATDEMTRLVAMYPEVWFMDVVAGTNRQKRGLFKMAIRTPGKKVFPGNLTVIPSGRRWVFYCIYKLAFIHIYGRVTCSRNRMALTDEDPSEFGPYEDLIATCPEFKLAILCLCIFHGVWGSFKAQIFPKLPRKSKKSPLLSAVGEEWACFLYESFRKQCTDHVSKEEYDRSHDLLTAVLKDSRTEVAIGRACIEAMKDLQLQLQSQQKQFAYYPRRGVTMSFKAKTTSPVESCNKVTKHGPDGVDSNMNLSTSLPKIAMGVNNRLDDFNNQSIRQLGQINRASQAPTKADICHHSQYLVDISYDNRVHVKLVQVGHEHWKAWNFHTPKKQKTHFPWSLSADFHRVWDIRINRFNGKPYCQCGCLQFDELGYPCECFYALFGEITHDSINIQHYKVYHPFYGRDTALGRALNKKQQEQVLAEKQGIPVTQSMVTKAQSANAEGTYPFLFPNTSEDDYSDAQFVSSRTTTTHFELVAFRERRKKRAGQAVDGDTWGGTDGDIFPEPVVGTHTSYLSQETRRLHDQIERSVDDVRLAQTTSEKQEARKRGMEYLDFILDHPNADRDDVSLFLDKMSAGKDAVLQQIKAKTEGQRKHPPEMPVQTRKQAAAKKRQKAAGDESYESLSSDDSKTTLAELRDKKAMKKKGGQKKARKGGVDPDDDGEDVSLAVIESEKKASKGIVWGANTSRRGAKQTRQRNNLG